MSRGAGPRRALLWGALLLAPAAEAGRLPTWSDRTFDPLVARRTNWCPQMGRVLNNTVRMRDALRGARLAISVPNPVGYAPTGFINYDQDGALLTGQDAGFLIEILDELAKRAGFTWRDSFSYFEDPNKYNRTWTDLVLWQTNSYDLSGEWWMPTVARREMGVSFLNGFFDSSIILVQESQGRQSTRFIQSLKTVFGPLTPAVWWSSIGCAFIVGIAYWMIESGETGSDLVREVGMHNAALSIVGALLLLVRGGGPKPHTFPGFFLVCGWSLFCLVVITSYSANLVAFLIAPQPMQYPMRDIEDGVARGVPLCVWTSAAMGPILRARYPKMRVVAATQSTLLPMLQEGKCQGAMLNKDTWELQKLRNDYNSNCTLAQTGDVIYADTAGWAVKADSGGMCTNLVRDTLDIFLKEMELSGVIREFKKRWLANQHDHSCDGGDSSDQDCSDGACALDWIHFAGMYLILGVVTVISVAWGRRVNHKARSGGSLHSHDRQDSHFRTTSRGFVKKKSQVQPFGDSARQLQIDSQCSSGPLLVHDGASSTSEGQMLSAQTVRAVVQEALQQLQEKPTAPVGAFAWSGRENPKLQSEMHESYAPSQPHVWSDSGQALTLDNRGDRPGVTNGVLKGHLPASQHRGWETWSVKEAETALKGAHNPVVSMAAARRSAYSSEDWTDLSASSFGRGVERIASPFGGISAHGGGLWDGVGDAGREAGVWIEHETVSCVAFPAGDSARRSPLDSHLQSHDHSSPGVAQAQQYSAARHRLVPLPPPPPSEVPSHQPRTTLGLCYDRLPTRPTRSVQFAGETGK